MGFSKIFVGDLLIPECLGGLRLMIPKLGLTTWNHQRLQFHRMFAKRLGPTRPNRNRSSCVEFQAFSRWNLEIQIQIYPTKSTDQSIPMLQHEQVMILNVLLLHGIFSRVECSSYFCRSNGGMIASWSSRMYSQYSHPSTHQPFSWPTAGYGG